MGRVKWDLPDSRYYMDRLEMIHASIFYCLTEQKGGTDIEPRHQLFLRLVLALHANAKRSTNVCSLSGEVIEVECRSVERKEDISSHSVCQ